MHFFAKSYMNTFFINMFLVLCSSNNPLKMFLMFYALLLIICLMLNSFIECKSETYDAFLALHRRHLKPAYFTCQLDGLADDLAETGNLLHKGLIFAYFFALFVVQN